MGVPWYQSPGFEHETPTDEAEVLTSRPQCGAPKCKPLPYFRPSPHLGYLAIQKDAD